MADFIAKGTPEAPITKNELEIILTKLVKNCGANKLKQEVKNRFLQSIRDPLLRFVGQPNSRDKMFIEISEVLFNEIRYVRTLVGGHPFTVGVEGLENDEDAPRHISHVEEDDVQVDKNISLSVAEVKALTCYGSGEDEESNPSNDDDSSADENPQTEINKEKSPDSSNSRMGRHIVVTGFGPFKGTSGKDNKVIVHDKNASWEAVKVLKEKWDNPEI